jgi:predicted transcriptional regulator
MSRIDDVMLVICEHARMNNGAVPNNREIASQIGVSQQRVNYLMMRLALEGRIQWINRYVYKVIDATWEPPPNVVL